MNLTFTPSDPERDADRISWLWSHAFGSTPEDSRKWFDRMHPVTWVLRDPSDGDAIVAVSSMYTIGQFFGGVSVPMHGVAGITVAPEARGKGVAREVMARSLRLIHERGAPLSTLYPATQTLYRRVGYEQAGHLFLTTLPTASIDPSSRAGRVRQMRESDLPQIHALYRAYASTMNGWIDRDDRLWLRVFEPRGTKTDTFIAESDSGDITGYAVLKRRGDDPPRANGRKDITVTDFVFTSESAGRRLLAFLRDHESTVTHVMLTGGPWKPELFLLKEQRFTVTLKDYWMTRIVDAKRAIEARTYPAHLRARIELDLADDLFAHNSGRFAVEFEAGRAKVTSGAGSGAVRCDIRALAALYTGFASARTLAFTGAVSGPSDQLDALSAALAPSNTPAMTDMF